MSLVPGSAQHAADPDIPAPADLIEVARITGSYGVRGWIKMAPEGSAQDSVLRSIRRWWLRDDAGALFPVMALSAREHSGSLIAQLDGITTREMAMALRGKRVCVSRAEFPALPAGQYYWADLIGCDVLAADGVLLGRIEGVVDHGAHPILVVAPVGKAPTIDNQILIPFVERYLLSIDLGRRSLQVDWEREA